MIAFPKEEAIGSCLPGNFAQLQEERGRGKGELAPKPRFTGRDRKAPNKDEPSTLPKNQGPPLTSSPLFLLLTPKRVSKILEGKGYLR